MKYAERSVKYVEYEFIYSGIFLNIRSVLLSHWLHYPRILQYLLSIAKTFGDASHECLGKWGRFQQFRIL